ncbi:MAG: DegT/DnrJ/EryC1/StrS family aminotransferase, partial [Candidatus Sumerlaeota bacterium]|nr:DegT/DnrJ/EryC1/StrS family aminotransferase [Candidatus Sumerlaeota bacterium]
YEKLFAGSEIVTPEVCDDGSHTYSCYTIKVRDRDRLQNFLKENEIGSEIYYPRGLHREPALEKLGLTRGPLPVTDEASRKVLSLPCYPGMKRSDVEKVAGVVLEFLKRNESFDHRRR